MGPDHYARLAAVSQMIKILTASRPIPKAPEPKREEEGIVDYEQLCKIVESKAAEGGRAEVAIPAAAMQERPRRARVISCGEGSSFCPPRKRKLIGNIGRAAAGRGARAVGKIG
jgi:hypothetical protein